MKKYIQLLILMFAFLALLSCGSKSKEESTDTVLQTEAVADETKVPEDAAVKHARIEKAKAEKAEQRKLALAETAKTSPTYKDAAGNIIYYKAETDPAYQGGNDAMMKYLSDNVIYPDAARANVIEGTVFVDFIVGKDGKVRDVVATDVAGDVDQSLKDEAVRVVSSMPAWIPGRHKGAAVETKYDLPVTFQLVTN